MGTPRDPFVDTVRALATVCVVVVHWLMADASWDGRHLTIGNALSHGLGWVATWLFQVLGLLFFAAGAAAAYGLQSGPGAAERGAARGVVALLRRIARPVMVLVVAWAVLGALLLVTGLPGQAVLAVAVLSVQILWFLGILVVLTALAPLLRRGLHRTGWWGVALLAAVPLVTEWLRFGAGLDRLAWVDVVVVWAVPYAIGLLYADSRAGVQVVRRGRLGPVAVVPSGRRLVVIATGLLALAALLVAVGPYPVSLVGMPGDRMSNLSPPTAPVLLHAVALVLLALAARHGLRRWGTGRGRTLVTTLVTTLAARSMTVYLWHVTAMVAVVAVVVVGLRIPMPVPGSADWWASRPLWLGSFGLVLAVIARVVGRAESRPRRGRVEPAVSILGSDPPLAVKDRT